MTVQSNIPRVFKYTDVHVTILKLMKYKVVLRILQKLVYKSHLTDKMSTIVKLQEIPKVIKSKSDGIPVHLWSFFPFLPEDCRLYSCFGTPGVPPVGGDSPIGGI